jgi:tyrosinase-like protein
MSCNWQKGWSRRRSKSATNPEGNAGRRRIIRRRHAPIRAISGDDTFSYPYWNWSNDRTIPAAFSRPGSPLANANRYTPPRALNDGEVDYYPDDPMRRALGVASLAADHFQALNPDDIPLSFGGIMRPNAWRQYGRNWLEGAPHPAVHNYVGGTNGHGVPGDMTVLATAGRDPIFFAHHGNLDRLWEIWRQDPRRRATEPVRPEFLHHSFVFRWLDGSPIEVRMGNILNMNTLGYQYDNLKVFRGGAPPLAIAQATAPPRLSPVASGKVGLPVATALAVGGKPRVYLEITGVQTPVRVMTVGVYARSSGAPANATGTQVGNFAAMLSAAGQISWPDDRLLFDITAVAQRYAGQQLVIELIPNRLSPSPGEIYPPLAYDRMQIIRG